MNDQLDPTWDPKEIATRCFNGHLIMAHKMGCMVAGCKYMDPDYASQNNASVLTEKPNVK